MKLKCAVFFVLFALITGLSSQAKADMYVGGLVGYGTVSGDVLSYTGGLAVGATAGIQLVPNLGVAATYLHNSLSVGSTDVGVSELLAEANFFTIIFFPTGVHIGEVTTSVGGSSTTDFGFGLHTGFDINLVANVTVGAAAYWTYVTTSNDKHSLFDLVVPIKFHF